MRVPSVSVVVPVYNSEESLPVLVDRIDSALHLAGIENFEIILVNDNSRDRSWQVIQDLTVRYPFVHGVDLMRNYGQHNALLCGIRAARYEVIVTMDDDLQNPPDEVPRLLKHLEEGYDVVYGYPADETHGLLRNIASKITKLALQSAMGVKTARHVSTFRAFRTHVREAFQLYQGPFVSIDVLLSWGTTNFSAIPARNDSRTMGASNYTLSKLITHAMNMMTGFSTLPLQLASMVGFAAAFFGLCILTYVIFRFVQTGQSVPGFPFLASIIAIFSGTQLFALGILGEYLARMHFRLMDRPSYAVRTMTAASASQSTIKTTGESTEATNERGQLTVVVRA